MKNAVTFMTRMLIDSNILVYAYDISSERHQKALDFFKNILLSDSAVVSIQNIVEFSRIMTEKIKNPISPVQTRFIVSELSETMDIIYYDSHTVSDALNISSMNKIHFFDALLAATMEKEGISSIATENEKDFRKISWITVINPLK
jgi:predicted nucleic acid-binding protein